MNINRVKNKYPYKKTTATIKKIYWQNKKSGYEMVYDKYDAIDDLRSSERYNHLCLGSSSYSVYDIEDKIYDYASSHFGVVEDSLDGKICKIYKSWYYGKIEIEYTDMWNKIHRTTIEATSDNMFTIKGIVKISYKIDNPDYATTAKVKTIDDYKKNIHFLIFTLGFILILVCMFVLMILLM